MAKSAKESRKNQKPIEEKFVEKKKELALLLRY